MSMMTSLSLLLILFAAARAATPPYSCSVDEPKTRHLPFCNRTLPTLSRARDLVSRLTLDEKIAQRQHRRRHPRLGVPRSSGGRRRCTAWLAPGRGSTSIGAGSRPPPASRRSFSVRRRLKRISGIALGTGQLIGREARAVYNEGQAKGLTFWAENINIFRDPRWGRGQETPGEDPLLKGKYAISYVRGVQGDSFQGGSLKGRSHLASACCKHFTAYDLDRWNGIDRFQFNAQVNAQDLADTFQPPFQSCIQQARATGIMCA